MDDERSMPLAADDLGSRQSAALPRHEQLLAWVQWDAATASERSSMQLPVQASPEVQTEESLSAVATVWLDENGDALEAFDRWDARETAWTDQFTKLD